MGEAGTHVGKMSAIKMSDSLGTVVGAWKREVSPMGMRMYSACAPSRTAQPRSLEDSQREVRERVQ